MRKPTVLALLSGVLLSGAIVGFLWFAKTFGEGFLSWGKAEVHFAAEARDILKYSKLRPSPAATDIYCYQEGFQDYTIYISYTDSAEHLRSITEAQTGKKIEEMESFPPHENNTMEKFDSPGQYDKRFLTPLFDIRSIKRGVYHLGQDGNDPWFIIWDTERNRLYYRHFSS